MEFYTVNPRNIEQAIATISEYKEKGFVTVGFEVTLPSVDEMLDLNFDPQHLGNKPEISCCMDVHDRLYKGEVHPIFNRDDNDKILVVFLRADLDCYLGALLFLHPALVLSDEFTEFTKIVNSLDTAKNTPWVQKDVFSKDNPGFEINDKLGPLHCCVSDWKRSEQLRIEDLFTYVMYNECDPKYTKQYQESKAEIINAFNNGETKVEKVSDKVTLVVSKQRAATSIAYSYSPIGIAVNPEFSFQGGPIHMKYSVFQWNPSYMDMLSFKKELSELDPGSGGSDTFVGSPQGENPNITIDTLLELVLKYVY